MPRSYAHFLLCLAALAVQVSLTACAPPADEPASTDSTTAADMPSDVPTTSPCKTAADCPTTSEPCRTAACQPGVGCTIVLAVDDSPCDDGDACTPGDRCIGGQCASGKAKDCADQDPCTLDACQAGACSHTPATGSPCDDGDVCTQGETCQAGQCTGGKATCQCQTDADCPDADLCDGKRVCDTASHQCVDSPASAITCPKDQDTPCRQAKCQPSTGQCILTAAPDGTACEDGTLCTTGDSCQGGTCQIGTFTCECKTDADCVGKDDGNLCNGTLFCNQQTGKCAPNPASPVTCPSVDDTACRKNLCQPKTGLCAMVDANDGLLCDDGNPCTASDACQKGQCQGPTNTCPCQKDADCSSKEDGDLCNGTLYCDVAKAQCKVNPKTVVTCAGQAPACHQIACQPKTGQCQPVALPDGVTCNADDNPCTPADTCQAGTCQADQNVCPCQQDGQCAGKDDGDLCNGTLWCDKLANVCKVNPASLAACPTVDDTFCQQTVCLPKTGQCAAVPVHEGQVCDADGNPCTPGDVCQLGTCVNQANTCECTVDADCAKKEDGNLCNGTLFCDKVTKTCQVNPATVVTCPTSQDTACSLNTCEPASGKCAMKAVNDFGKCDADGNPCTVYDTCSQGKCLAGANLCACQLDEHCPDDKDLCNGKPFCDKSGAQPKCVPNPVTVVTCTKTYSGGCAVDKCNSLSGQCLPVELPDGATCAGNKACHAPGTCQKGDCQTGLPLSGTPCDDGNPCTDVSECQQGNCAAVSYGACDDKDPCTQDACDGTGGKVTCKFLALCVDTNPCTDDTCVPGGGPQGYTCSTTYNTKACDADGNPCTQGDQCSGGTCKPGAGCDDGNPCTADACDAGKACTHTATLGGCDDGDKCSQQDTCKEGKCQAGPALACNDGEVCTDDACDPKTGCTTTPNTKACVDGNACTSKDVCKNGQCTGGIANTCEDGNACTADSCDPKTGCSWQKLTGSACDDEDACSLGEKCADGACTGASPKVCDDGDPCTGDFCSTQDGACKVNLLTGGACDDGNPCTGGDACSSGQCKGNSLGCGATDECVSGGCVPPSGQMQTLAVGVTFAGCNEDLDSQCLANEKPRHQVNLTQAFAIDRFEVTVSRYQKCVGAGKCSPPDVACSEGAHSTWGKPKPWTLPVNCVTWQQATDYCQWMDPKGRLPTEAEWEYGARGNCDSFGTTDECKAKLRVFPWGNQAPDCTLANFEASPGKPCTGGPAAVGSLEAGNSPFGARDMAGNVLEWTADWFGDYAAGTLTNPTGPANGGQKVVKGGSAVDPASSLRSSARTPYLPSVSSAYVGFRCARSM